ncbi:hypothetical protein [Halorubrum ezzemoulense]|uniref:hypothetical protein n=1 Tax=Halorubrum ezzemoulense TaxID=337243 RepID=UPI00232F0BEF|nr:hypothetical protein [Halorubrum ezzemoulense]MDB9252949.1 hypothetical protein [Halorubrum ezzemoulense]MDB9256666.1 hypothetical protein [Halorubrum ezzemoulense]MDB9278073.1 hypothetical protein [Halorubrum ezzemoulense]
MSRCNRDSVAIQHSILNRFSGDDRAALHETLAEFESALSAALEEDDGGETYRDVFWRYHERVSDALDEAVRATGWSLLEEVIDAYDPTADDELPLVTPTIANAVGRNLIRTRVTESVEAIPVSALEYLDGVAVTASDTADTTQEEVHAYGWGIGHPDHSVADRLHARVSEDIFSVTPTLEHAFYADQYAAVDLLEALVKDESIDGTFSRPARDDMPSRRYLLDSVYGLKTDDHWPGMPRYYDWHEEFDDTFELDDTVEQRIRDLVEEIGFDADLPNDWTFRDLGV